MLEICLKWSFQPPVRRLLLPLLLLGYALNCGWAQDPGAAEDAQIERQKILRAADQIEVINDQHNKMVEQVEALRVQVKAATEANEALARQIAEIKTQASKEREALLEQISKMMVDQEKRLSEKIHTAAKPVAEEAPRKAAPPKEAPAKGKEEEGYEYVVQPGQTLWSIAKAYQDQGVKVSVEDIRKANSLKEGQALRSGQKLFIPGK